MDADTIIDRRKLKRKLTYWRIAAVLMLVALIGVVAAETYPGKRDHIARISIRNIIVEDRERDQALTGIMKDEHAKALIVRINSPGGTTAGSEELFQGLRRVAAKKPVVAVIGTLGASGGYIAAIGADYIVARETSLTGSIGVLMQTAEFSGLMEKLGISAEKITSGALKGKPSVTGKMDDDVRRVFQALIDDSHAWFLGLVKERRKLSDAAVRSVGDGRVFTGRQAKASGLIDAFGGESVAITWLGKEKKLKKSLPVQNVYWGPEADPWNRRFRSMLGYFIPTARHTLDGLLALWQPR